VIPVRLFDPGTGVNWRYLTDFTGADPASISRLLQRDRITVILAENLSCPAASILKQCMLSGGADALVHREVITCRVPLSNAVIYGTPSAIRRGCFSLKEQPFQLGALSEKILELLCRRKLPESITVNGVKLGYSRQPLIMGILNVTPDSFSDGGMHLSPETAADHALFMEKAGASLIDTGGESTRPGSAPVSADEQMNRVIPVIEAVRSASSIPISIDTCIPEVARAACRAGAGMINSIDGMETPGMAEAAAELGVPVCVMHKKGTPETMQDNPGYRDAVKEIADYLLSRVEYLGSLGIAERMILVDPGIGFGKTLDHNIQLLRSLDSISRHTGCRLLLGHSRKSFLGMITGVKHPGERDALTHVVTSLVYGADVIRVHDVVGTSSTLKVKKMLEECV